MKNKKYHDPNSLTTVPRIMRSNLKLFILYPANAAAIFGSIESLITPRA